MFDTLTDKLTAVFRKLTNRGRLTEKDVDEALREVRMALLEADVNFKVVRDFIAKVRELGAVCVAGKKCIIAGEKTTTDRTCLNR